MTEGPSSATPPQKKYQCSQLEAGTRGQEVKPRRDRSRKPGPAPNDPLTTHSAVLGPQEGDLPKGIKARKPVDQTKLIKDPKEPEAQPESGDTARPGPQASGRRTAGRRGLNKGTDSSVRTSCTPVLPQSHQPAPPEHGAAFQKHCRVSGPLRPHWVPAGQGQMTQGCRGAQGLPQPRQQERGFCTQSSQGRKSPKPWAPGAPHTMGQPDSPPWRPAVSSSGRPLKASRQNRAQTSEQSLEPE